MTREPSSDRRAGRSEGLRRVVLGFRPLGRLNLRALMALADQGVVSATSLLTTIIIGRFCGSEGLGLFALGVSLLLLSTAAQSSLVSTPYTVFRKRSAGRIDPLHHAGGSLIGGLLLAGGLTLLAVLVAGGLQWGAEAASVRVLAWAVVLCIPCFLAREFARRFEFASFSMRNALLIDCSVAVLQLGMLLLFALQGWLTSANGIALIAAACLSVFLVWAIRRRGSFRLRGVPIRSAIKHDWLFGRWLFADQLMAIAQLYVMHWLLSFLIGPAAAGVLAACASIANLANPILLGVGNYLGPRFAETVSLHSRRTTVRLYWETTGLLMLGAGIFSGVAIVFGSELLWLFYRDPAYAAFGSVVALLAMRLVMAIPTVAANHAVVAMESPRGSAMATVVGLLTILILAFPLISTYQVLGAAIALVVGTAVESVCLLWVFYRRLSVWQWRQTDEPDSNTADEARAGERAPTVASQTALQETASAEERPKVEPTS